MGPAAAALILLLATPTAPAEAGPTPPAVAGRWARLTVNTALSKLPVVGELSTETRGLVLVDVTQEGRRLRLRETVCALEAEGVGPVETRFPLAFVRAVSGATKAASLEPEGGAWRWVEPRAERVLGARLAPGEPLPRTGEDPRVVDGDGDGAPALSVEVRGLVSGRVFVVQRDWSALEGRLRSPRSVEGEVRWGSEQRVVGAEPALLQQDPSSRPHPDPTKSWFRMTRVPSGARCAELIARAGKLFGVRGFKP
jgi:hypothetical protein